MEKPLKRLSGFFVELSSILVGLPFLQLYRTNNRIFNKASGMIEAFLIYFFVEEFGDVFC